MKKLLFLCFYLSSFLLASQEYAMNTIPLDIKKGMYAVKHLDATYVELKDYDEMVYSKKQIISVFDKRAWQNLSFVIPYDNFDKISVAEAKIYNANGEEIKKIKKREFLDVSSNSSNLYDDDRLLLLDFTPSFYPFTIEFNYEIETSDTAWIPSFYPMSDDEISIINTTYELVNAKKLSLKKCLLNLKEFNVSLEEKPDKIYITASNLIPKRFERMSNNFSSYFPIAQFAPNKFMLQGVSANVETWDDFADWQIEKLLKGQDDLPEQTISKINNLVSGVDDPKEKAKLIYEYVQGKTRYVSIQIGIGGWKPTAASEVDKLGYGDCKGLTNYTKALLKSQGIDSYYTLVNAFSNGKDIDEEFVALQGNHAILAIPFEDELTFLECTNQSHPFGYIGTFTDNRKVLMITPEGGKITTTTKYSAEDNLQKTSGAFVLNDALKLHGNLQVSSSGLAYGKRYQIPSLKKKEILELYKEQWGYHRNVNIDAMQFENDKEKILFTESLTISSDAIVSKAGDKILFTPNLFNQNRSLPKTYKNRKQPFKVRRGYSYEDTVEIRFPSNYEIASVFDAFEIETPFGKYAISATVDKEKNTVIYQRNFISFAGTWSNDLYQDYTDFCKTINKKDKQKILLNKIK